MLDTARLDDRDPDSRAIVALVENFPDISERNQPPCRALPDITAKLSFQPPFTVS